MSVAIEMKFPKLRARLLSKRSELALFLAAQVQTNRGLLFMSEGSRNGGDKWKKPLLRSGRALQKSGALRKSLAPGTGRAGPFGVVRILGDNVVVGTRVKYAQIVNKGGTFTAAPGKAFRIPIPGGKGASPTAKAIRSGLIQTNRGLRRAGLSPRPTNVIFRTRITIPARRFDILTVKDKKEIAIAYQNKVAELLGGGK